ncbi:hypothetical protein ACHAXN_010596 [Cyclotella atomus]
MAASTLSRHLASISHSSIHLRSKLPIHASNAKYFSIHPTPQSSNNHKPFSTSTQQSPDAEVQVPPPPSWSISELRLLSSSSYESDKLSSSELSTLARRCLIDIRRLTPERREQLKLDVGGVMRCASVLLDVKNLTHIQHDSSGGCKEDVHVLSDVDVYDAPRGLIKIPIRRDDVDHCKLNICHDAVRDEEDGCEQQVGESRAVLGGETVKAKMVEAGGEKYFSVVTKRE